MYMKRILFIILIILLLCFLSFRTYASGIKEIDGKIKIPSFSFFIKKEEEKITVKNFRSSKNIEKELKKNYYKITCHNKTYYYDKKQDYTIIEYKIEDYKIISSITILYKEGNICKTLQEK